MTTENNLNQRTCNQPRSTKKVFFDLSELAFFLISKNIFFDFRGKTILVQCMPEETYRFKFAYYTDEKVRYMDEFMNDIKPNFNI